jgi:hypothetical protein
MQLTAKDWIIAGLAVLCFWLLADYQHRAAHAKPPTFDTLLADLDLRCKDAAGTYLAIEKIDQPEREDIKEWSQRYDAMTRRCILARTTAYMEGR